MLGRRRVNCSREISVNPGNLALWLMVNLLALFTVSAAAQDSINLVGAGGSVTLPLFEKWGQGFNRINHSVRMQYQSMATAEGIKLIYGSQAELGKSDFSAGEIILTEKERREGNLIQLPVVTIAIVPCYNLPNQPQLKFTGELLAQIYLGHVKSWNAPQIAKLNPGVALPSITIKVVYRPAGTGSNFIFTDFLSKVSPEFRSRIGHTASPKWPVGESAEHSSNVVAKITGEIGSLGYVELQYAQGAGLSTGLVQNAAGKFVQASDASINAACRSIQAPEWNRFSASLTNAPGADSFPIASFSWIYLRADSPASKRKAALISLLQFIYTNGQQVLSEQGYAALPPPLLDRIKTRIATL